MAGCSEVSINDRVQTTVARGEKAVELAGTPWSKQSPILDVLNSKNQVTKADWLPPDPFGDIDGQLLALKNNERNPLKNSENQSTAKETAVNYLPTVTASKITQVEKHLSTEPHRFKEDTNPAGPKCNVYLDALMHDSELPRPWADKGVPLCLDMQGQLSKDPRYEEAWSTDYNDYKSSYALWARFQQKPGDILLWNTNIVTHGAVADGTGSLYYAGAGEKHTSNGCYHAASTYVTGTVEAPTNYGPPTKVFRYKGVSDSAENKALRN